MSDLTQNIPFTGSGLNHSDLPHYFHPGDAQYRQNVAIYEENGIGELQNALGMESKNYIFLPAGTNTVIGTCEDRANLALIYFICNSNGNHCILRWNSQPDTIDIILWEELKLGLISTNLILNAGVIGDVLKWTDGGEPHSLNITKALLYTKNKLGDGIGSLYIESPDPIFTVN